VARPTVTIGTGPDDPRAWVQAVHAILDAARQVDPGDKLPTQVQIAGALGVSLFTARHAYQELARMRLVHLVPGHGYYPGDGT
jgi:DNA-binding transcriptional regulator YhcF (GntR family)